MRRGCLSVGTVSCDICKRKIPYPERYVMVDEDTKGNEVEKGGKSVRYCIEDAQKKGYAHYKEIKGEMILTFLRESEAPLPTQTPAPAPSEEAKETIETKEPKVAKQTKEPKAAKESKAAKAIKEPKERD